MGFFLRGIISMDDSEARATLRATESEISRTAGRTGQIIKSQTRGVRELSGAVLGGAALGGMVAGTSFTIGRAIRSQFEMQERVNAAVRQEIELRDRVLLQMDRAIQAQRERLGLAPKQGENITSLIAQASDFAQKIQEARDRAFEAAGKIAQIEGSLGKGGTLFGIDIHGVAEISAGMDEAVRSAKEYAERLREINGLIDDAEEADRRAKAEREYQQLVRETSAVLRQRADMARAMGDEEEALRIDEQLRHNEAKEAIRTLAKENRALYDEMMAREAQIHARRMANIEAQIIAERRKRAEEEAEQKRVNDLSNEMQRLQLDADEARARGDETAAKLLEERVRLMRELEAIRRAQGLSDEERARRIAQAEEISRLRREAIEQGAEGDARPREGDDAGIGAGITRTDALLRQVFQQKDPDAKHWAKQTQQLQDVIDSIRDIRDRTRSQPMLALG